MSDAWNEYYTKEELDQIQKIELESLDVFSKLSKKLDIDFFLYGGSLLGAVKYGGFVPWDDDLDIALMRKDYEKLIKEGPALLPDGYELQEPRLNKKTPYPYIKFRKSNTTMVEYVNRNIKINHGVYFDIYPIDNLPDDNERLENDRKKLLKLTIILKRKQSASAFHPKSGWKGIVLKTYFFATHIVARMIPHKYLIRKMNIIMTKYNDIETTRQGNLFFPKPVNYFDGIYPAIEIDFERRKMLIPCGYKVNLENRYGDITKEPPSEEKIGHKPYILKINLEK